MREVQMHVWIYADIFYTIVEIAEFYIDNKFSIHPPIYIHLN